MNTHTHTHTHTHKHTHTVNTQTHTHTHTHTHSEHTQQWTHTHTHTHKHTHTVNTHTHTHTHTAVNTHTHTHTVNTHTPWTHTHHEHTQQWTHTHTVNTHTHTHTDSSERTNEHTHTHTHTHTHGAVGSQLCCGVRGAVGVSCSRVEGEEGTGYSLPHLLSLLTRYSNSQPFDYETYSLTIRPDFPQLNSHSLRYNCNDTTLNSAPFIVKKCKLLHANISETGFYPETYGWMQHYTVACSVAVLFYSLSCLLPMIHLFHDQKCSIISKLKWVVL